MDNVEKKICLDTDFLVNFLRNKREEIEFIKNQNKEMNILATTYLNLFELYLGAFKSEKSKEILSIEILKERLLVLNLDDNVVRKAGEIAAKLEKDGNAIDFRDLLIGTICLANGFHLKTYNISHFSRMPGLKLIQ